jgi:YgiT-type zinc finger domain-containing protein
MDAEPVLAYGCQRCLTGHLQPRLVTLTEWAAGEFITVPNFPAWVCDVCGQREYDAVALEHLQAVLGPQAALRRQSRPAPAEPGRRPAAPGTARRHRV